MTAPPLQNHNVNCLFGPSKRKRHWSRMSRSISTETPEVAGIRTLTTAPSRSSLPWRRCIEDDPDQRPRLCVEVDVLDQERDMTEPTEALGGPRLEWGRNRAPRRRR